MSEPSPSTPSLIGDALREATDLVKREIDLFRAETAGNLGPLIAGVGLLAAAALFAVIALIMPILALVKWLAVVLGSEALARLIVGGAFILVAIVLAFWGRSKMSISGLEPRRTERQVRQDLEMTREHVDA